MELSNNWDFCVIGNGVTSLLTCHYLWSNKKSVLWVSSEPVFSPTRALTAHAWNWASLVETARPFFGEGLPPFEAIYYDAKSSKRFKPFLEAKKEFGEQEDFYFDGFAHLLKNQTVDVWKGYEKLSSFYSNKNDQALISSTELFSSPRFVRLQGWPVVELKTDSKKITSVVLGREIEIKASHFVLGDHEEAYRGLISDESCANELSAAFKGRAFKTGFGVHFWHKSIPQTMTQTCVIPLVVSPKPKEASHVMGRFLPAEEGSELTESVWFGFLTEAELEDNNEILKKIKLTRRAVDRAIPGFHDSIVREAVTFEQRMCATLLSKKMASKALGAFLISDYFGLEPGFSFLQDLVDEVGAAPLIPSQETTTVPPAMDLLEE